MGRAGRLKFEAAVQILNVSTMKALGMLRRDDIHLSTLMKIESSVGWNSVVATLVIGPPRQGCIFVQSFGIVALVTLAIVSLVAG
jgi:hypothetical protein